MKLKQTYQSSCKSYILTYSFIFFNGTADSNLKKLREWTNNSLWIMPLLWWEKMPETI